MRALLTLGLMSSLSFANESMRIALVKDVSEISIEGSHLQLGADVDDSEFNDIGRERATVSVSNNEMQVDGKASRASALRFHSQELKINGVCVRGDAVVIKIKNKLTAINVLNLEDYLVGVIGSEMPKSFPEEALKAQAVAARTYALHKKIEQFGKPFFLGSSVISQVYKGLSVEDPRTRKAVEETKGQVLTFHLEPVEAYFHASCGGHTENGRDALGRDLPYLKSVACDCHSLKTSHWTLNLKKNEMQKLGGDIKVDNRTSTGRARTVTLGHRTFDAVRLREKVGYMKMKSLNFQVEETKDGGAKIEGQGFGHGAGMCQQGARLRAEKGDGYKDILAHYYPGTEVFQMY
jgi:stage II sporulation protein D